MSAGTSTQQQHLNLIVQQRGPRHLGFNPFGPRSHRWMMDAKYPPKFRAYGWLMWRTNDRDPDGQTGPPKKKRTPFAHDTRVGSKGHLEEKHMAEDLGMTLPNAIDEMNKLVEEERAFRDEKGRIFLNANSPEPRRIKSEDNGEGSDTEEPIFFCSENCPEAYHLIFQALDKKRRAQYVRLYRAMPEALAKHYEALETESRARHTWRYLQANEYREQLEADAMAAARSAGRQVVESVCAEAGYVDGETRGRKEVSRELTVEVNVRVDPLTFSIQKTGTGNLYKGENASAQKTVSLFPSFTGSHSEVNRPQVENSASEQEKEAPNGAASSPTPPTTPPQNLPDKGADDDGEPSDPFGDPSPIIASVQAFFRRKLSSHDPLHTQFPELAQRLNLPQCSVCRWIGEKAERKEQQRYRIFSPGALYEFACRDLPGWIAAQRHADLDADRRWEEQEQRRVALRTQIAGGGA